MAIKNCVVCGGEFVARGPKKTCSVKCVEKKNCEYQKRYRIEHLEKIHEHQCRRLANRHAERSEYQRQYRLDNVEKLCEKNQRRNVKIAAALRLLKELETKGIGALL